MGVGVGVDVDVGMEVGVCQAGGGLRRAGLRVWCRGCVSWSHVGHAAGCSSGCGW